MKGPFATSSPRPTGTKTPCREASSRTFPGASLDPGTGRKTVALCRTWLLCSWCCPVEVECATHTARRPAVLGCQRLQPVGTARWLLELYERSHGAGQCAENAGNLAFHKHIKSLQFAIAVHSDCKGIVSFLSQSSVLSPADLALCGTDTRRGECGKPIRGVCSSWGSRIKFSRTPGKPVHFKRLGGRYLPAVRRTRGLGCRARGSLPPQRLGHAGKVVA